MSEDNLTWGELVTASREIKGIHYRLVPYESYYDQQVARKKAKVFGTIKKVIFNDPATIVLWADGTKTVVKCAKDEKFDPEKGLAMAIAKKVIGNEGWYYDIFKKFLPKEADEK